MVTYFDDNYFPTYTSVVKLSLSHFYTIEQGSEEPFKGLGTWDVAFSPISAMTMNIHLRNYHEDMWIEIEHKYRRSIRSLVSCVICLPSFTQVYSNMLMLNSRNQLFFWFKHRPTQHFKHTVFILHLNLHLCTLQEPITITIVGCSPDALLTWLSRSCNRLFTF